MCHPYVILTWSYVYWIWGAIVLSETTQAKGECCDIWTFGLVSVIFTAIFGTISTTRTSVQGMVGTNPYMSTRHHTTSLSSAAAVNPAVVGWVFGISTIAVLLTLIWGFVIYGTISASCQEMYQDEFPMLWTYFQAALCSSLIVFVLTMTGLVFMRERVQQQQL